MIIIIIRRRIRITIKPQEIVRIIKSIPAINNRRLDPQIEPNHGHRGHDDNEYENEVKQRKEPLKLTRAPQHKHESGER